MKEGDYLYQQGIQKIREFEINKSSVLFSKDWDCRHRWSWNQPDEKFVKNTGCGDRRYFVMLKEFVNTVRVKGPTPLDVYDSVVMSAIVELSGISIQKDRPVPFPDFTKGDWKMRKPYFAI